MHNSNNARMIGRHTGTQGRCNDRDCTCNGGYRDRAASRTSKRRERRDWMREVVQDMTDTSARMSW